MSDHTRDADDSQALPEAPWMRYAGLVPCSARLVLVEPSVN